MKIKILPIKMYLDVPDDTTVLYVYDIGAENDIMVLDKWPGKEPKAVIYKSGINTGNLGQSIEIFRWEDSV